jgi:polar amino acid transport system permease protein
MNELWVKTGTYLPVLMEGVMGTLLVTAGALILSTLLGLVWALMRVSGVLWLARLSEWIINILRSIPIIVILFYIYFVMPDVGFSLSAMQAGIIGLGLAYSSYQSENFRAGIQAVDGGQIEAAMSMGMGWATTMRRIVLPQALRITLPPYGNTMIMLLKDSSQASTITVAELAMQGKLLALSTFDNTTVFTMVAIMYMIMCLPLILVVKQLEKKGARK